MESDRNASALIDTAVRIQVTPINDGRERDCHRLIDSMPSLSRPPSISQYALLLDTTTKNIFVTSEAVEALPTV